MKATQKNICDVLGTNAKELKFSKTNLKNGYRITGFISRNALQDLMNNFHIYVNRQNQIVVLTPGRLDVTSRV